VGKTIDAGHLGNEGGSADANSFGGPVCGLSLPGNEATTALDIGTHHFGRASRSLVVDQLDCTKVTG
jgi:hypothetical protein